MFPAELQGKGRRQSGALHDQHGHRPTNLRQMRQCQTDPANVAREIRGA